MSGSTWDRGRLGYAPETLGPVHWLGAALAAITGSVHLYLYYQQGFLPFLLAGVGFFVAVVLLVFTQGLYRLLLYGVGVPFVLAQLGGYYTIERPDTVADMTTLAIVDKVVQVTLIAILAYLFVRDRREG